MAEAELENPSNTGDDSGEDAHVKSGKKGNGKKSPGGKTAKLPSYSLPTNMIPTFYVGGGNGTALVEGPLVALGWRRTVDKFDERYRLKWVECKSKINYTTFKEGEQLVNHVPNAHLLTNKLGLLNSLQEYERVTISTKGRPPRLKMSEFIPETYKLDEKNDRETFLELYKDNEVWICKPTGMNQGKGIFLIRSRDEILKLIEERDQKKQQPQKPGKPLMTRIVQRYISSPLLLDSRKFDIRAYMLIASTVPYLILYHKGYIRLSCQKYDAHDLNLTTHLTNQYIQKKDPSYKDVKEDTAWSMDKFNEYINEHYMEEKGLEKDWAYNTLTKTMQKIMIHCFNSVKHKLQCKIGFFDLFGLDFMVDSDMKVTLIEVNVNPALHINCEALKEVIPGVVEESLYLTIECFEKSRRNQALLPLSSLKSFTILYCGNRPNVMIPRQTRSVSPVKDITAEKTKMAATGANVRRGSPTRPPHHRSLTQSTSLYTSPNAQSIKKDKTETLPEEPIKSSLQREPTLATHSANAYLVPTITAATFTHTNSGVKDADENKNSNNAEDELGITTATPLTSVNTLPRLADNGQTSSMISASQRKTMDLNLVHDNSPASRISLTDSLLEEVKLKMTHARGTPSAKRDRDNLERGN
ncbi:hypothetical protein CHS0354_019895 [Potamilus streckersoni]|uniref:Uncharacterized protein n=1 Tax=Potamilus streckersoni TaxID=2493646 RepID=A0AAE0VY54_9BIVA|nr:hypothetical protein CHS0354_019895 [Potamilus streckersoni]